MPSPVFSIVNKIIALVVEVDVEFLMQGASVQFFSCKMPQYFCLSEDQLAAVQFSANALQLSGVKMGSGMTGKLGLAWVDTWVGVWVHGWWVGGGDVVMW